MQRGDLINGLRHILIVDDDPHYRYGASFALRMNGYTISESADGRDALALLRKNDTIDLVLSDFDMPGMSGGHLLHALQRTASRAWVIVVTGRSEAEVADSLSGVPYLAVIPKPVDARAFVAAIEGIFAKQASAPGNRCTDSC